MKRARATARPLERGDTVQCQHGRVDGSAVYGEERYRVVLVHDGEALLSREVLVSDEENAERKAKGLPKLDARTRYDVASLDHVVRA